ncbi:hypothetical protein H9P43_002789 [Blastocladiella emersonii ATCC 22665]|nr:hypothetical protein H9P43_002789 [Blastocladiella emersonii ATCC 22665]
MTTAYFHQVGAALWPVSALAALLPSTSGSTTPATHVVGTLAASGRDSTCSRIELWSVPLPPAHPEAAAADPSHLPHATLLAAGTHAHDMTSLVALASPGSAVQVASGHADGSVCLWPAYTGDGRAPWTPLRVEMVHAGSARGGARTGAPVVCLTEQPGAGALVSIGGNGDVRVVDLVSGKVGPVVNEGAGFPFEVVGAHWVSEVECLVVDEVGQVFFVDTRRGWAAPKSVYLLKAASPTDSVLCTASSGSSLCLGLASGHLVTLDISAPRTPRLAGVLPLEHVTSGPVRCLAAGPDSDADTAAATAGRSWVSGHEQGLAVIASVPTDSAQAVMPAGTLAPVAFAAVAPMAEESGAYVFGSEDGGLYVMAAASVQ